MSLSDRQWNQIRAALAFWRSVAETSRVHPINHPAVQGYFGDDQPTPLTEDEIEGLIQLPIDLLSGATASYAAGVYSISPGRLLAEFKRTGVQPMATVKGVRIYTSDAIATAVHTIQKRDKTFREKYHVADPKT